MVSPLECHYDVLLMAKRRQEERPPGELPIARLFLDDLEELARIFTDAQLGGHDPAEQGLEEPQTIYTVDEWECGTIQDLKDLGRYRKRFELKVERGVVQNIYIYAARRSFWWGSFGLPLEVEWAVYGQVLELVRRRKILSYPGRRPAVIFQTSFEYGGLFASLKRHGSQIAIAVVSSIGTLIAVGIAKTVWQYFRHTK
jgi:hypothetical protein